MFDVWAISFSHHNSYSCCHCIHYCCWFHAIITIISVAVVVQLSQFCHDHCRLLPIPLPLPLCCRRPIDFDHPAEPIHNGKNEDGDDHDNEEVTKKRRLQRDDDESNVMGHARRQNLNRKRRQTAMTATQYTAEENDATTDRGTQKTETLILSVPLSMIFSPTAHSPARVTLPLNGFASAFATSMPAIATVVPSYVLFSSLLSPLSSSLSLSSFMHLHHCGHILSLLDISKHGKICFANEA